MVEVDAKRFEQLVADALDQIPEELFKHIVNVAVMVEDEPESGDEGLLGEYIGVPVAERFDYSGVMPDQIKIYRGPICRMCETDEDVVDEVLVTVVHEVAHYFGFDDEQLHGLGWG